MRWFDKYGLQLIIVMAFIFISSALIVSYLYNDTELSLKYDNTTEQLIQSYETQLKLKDDECKKAIRINNENCMFKTPTPTSGISIVGNITTNFKTYGEYNIQWVKKGYRSPDGKFLTTCITSE